MRVVPLGSSKDPLFKAIRQLRSQEARGRRGTFLIEDPGAVRVALSQGHALRHVLASEAWLAEAPDWFASYPGSVHVASAGLLHKLFPTGKTPGLVAECDQVSRPVAELAVCPRLLVLEHIQDAGNLGSMLRTAEGLGIEDVVVLRSEVTDLYNRVAVRASMGSLLRLRLYEARLPELVEVLGRQGATLVVTTPHTERTLEDVERGRPLALAVGNETDGVSDALLEAAGERVRIPMSPRVESLNVGAACAIVLYALRPL